MAHRGPCKHDFDWKRELEEEETLTKEEIEQQKINDREEMEILKDLHECLDEIERREYEFDRALEREHRRQRAAEERDFWDMIEEEQFLGGFDEDMDS